MNDFATFSQTIVPFVATYFVHSTFLLTACWLVLKLTRAKSHFLIERLWKLSTVLGIVTALAQQVIGPITWRETLALRVPEPAKVAVSTESVGEWDRGDVAKGAILLPDIESGWIGQGADNAHDLSESVVDLGSDNTDLDQEIELAGVEITVASADLDSRIGGSTTETFSILDHAITSAPQGDIDAPSDEGLTKAKLRQASREWWPVLLQASVIVLVCGFVIGCFLLVIQTARWRLRFRTARVVRNGPAKSALDRFLRRHKIAKRIRLLVSNEHCEPLAYGLFRWTIVLPAGTEDRLDRDELRALLAHEIAHFVRGDVRWLWIGRVLCTCCAFQPLNLLARRRWQLAAEYLCDDWAIERGVRSLSLARCLTRVAEWRFGVAPPEFGLAAGGSKATLVQRVKRLVDEQPASDAWQHPRRRRALTAGAALAVVVIAGSTPRIALPLTLANERVIDVSPNSIHTFLDERAKSDWHALEEDLLQLDASLERVEQLRVGRNETSDVSASFQQLNRRANLLKARRERIASLFAKESRR